VRVAVIDLGTNSTRLLVAGVENGQVTELERCNTVTRLGRGVDLSRQLCSDAIEDVCAVVRDYLAVLRDMGAERVAAVATSAVRDASNGDAFIAELRERFSLDAQTLSGEEEARLTYLGATATREVAESTLVLDIGGGSTELVCGRGADVDFRTSLQVGTVRHTERHLLTDPPSAVALEELAADVRGHIDAAMSENPAAVAEHGIAVAGTPTATACRSSRSSACSRDSRRCRSPSG
jgi:exopolyphosphatase/guanosine-5'-triphosphate,3'-diphosphate pyrophosphatase